MAAGDRPVFRIVAKNKDNSLPNDEKYVDIGAAWKGNLDGVYSISLKEGVKIRANGQVLTFGRDGDFFLDLKEVDAAPKKAGKKAAKSAPPADEPEEDEDF